MAGAVPGPESSLTEESLRIICEALGKGMARKHAAGLAGITYSTLYRWMQEHEHVEQAVLLAESQDVEMCFRAINSAIETADARTAITAATWKLRNQHGYTDKSEVAVSAGPIGPQRALDPSRLTDSEYNEYMRLVEKMTVGDDPDVIDAEYTPVRQIEGE